MQRIIKADGGNLSTCVNAATLALSDAGIPMKGLVAASECGSVDGVACADISSREHNEMVPRVTLATVSEYYILHIIGNNL
jgi:exosome complex component RRP41